MAQTRLPLRRDIWGHALFLSALRVFQGGSGRRDGMRSRRCGGLKGKAGEEEGGGGSHPSPTSILLQRRLIAVDCGANSESKAAAAFGRAAGRPLAGVNGSRVARKIGGRVGK